METVKAGGKDVVAIRVDEFPVKPVACRDRYFKRVAAGNHKLSLTEIANLHMQSLQLSWDAYPEKGTAVRDLDSRKVRSFLARVKAGCRFRWTGDWRSVLGKLGFLNEGRPTHAAMILFGKADPPYSLHIGRFKTAATIIDDRMIRGTLFSVVEAAMQFIVSHLKVAFEITGVIERREIFEYPLPALRELLLNAVVHRDYTSPVDIQIKVFDNAIAFFSPGRLYGDLTVEKLDRDDYQSRTRNKLIAEALCPPWTTRAPALRMVSWTRRRSQPEPVARSNSVRRTLAILKANRCKRRVDSLRPKARQERWRSKARLSSLKRSSKVPRPR
ncbi:MAG: ATP-binding protein [Planctomycetota bacterium]